jgi:hypothetical protein
LLVAEFVAGRSPEAKGNDVGASGVTTGAPGFGSFGTFVAAVPVATVAGGVRRKTLSSLITLGFSMLFHAANSR